MEELKIPTHVTIIMDGNGRWARQRGLDRIEGHNIGTESVRACSEFAVEHKIKYLSLFAFSEENWNRPKEEVSALMSLMVRSIIDEKPTFRKNNIKFLVIGDRSRLSEELLNEVDIAIEETKENNGLSLIVFLSYSGKWDILQAVERYTQERVKSAIKGEEFPPLTIPLFEQYLATYGIPDPDLLIRTSGEQRISNFMLWQTAYTEFYFTDILWPDFRKNDFRAALESYSSRQRRYGKTSDQII